jgi:YHS domain-containing protein
MPRMNSVKPLFPLLTPPCPALPLALLRRFVLPLALVAVAALSGCTPMSAQNPDSGLRPVNAVHADSEERLMLKGADVVAYFTQGRFVPGVPAHRSVHEGVAFHFASAEHKALFDAAPQKYLPQYGGYCANGIVYGIPWGGDADTWRMIDGKLYIFGGAGSRDAFALDVPGNLALADRYWAQEVAGSNSFVQRAWRLVWRVPHYRSGAELAEAVEKARGRTP